MFIGKGVKDLMRYAWLGCTMIYLCFGKGFYLKDFLSHRSILHTLRKYASIYGV